MLHHRPTSDPEGTDHKASAVRLPAIIGSLVPVWVVFLVLVFLIFSWLVHSNVPFQIVAEVSAPGLIPASVYVRNLESGNRELIITGLGALEERNDPIAVRKAIELLKDSDSHVWLNAALYLGACNRQEAVPYLIKSLRHTVWRSDQTAARYLTNLAQRDFGTNFDKWQQWWTSSHPGANFDWESSLGDLPRLPETETGLTIAQTKERAKIAIRRASGMPCDYRDELLAVVFRQNLTDKELRQLKPRLEAWKESLQELILSGEGVTDAGLECLKGLRCLRRLTLIGTSVTETGVAQFHKDLPQVEVRRLPSGTQPPMPSPPSDWSDS